MLKESECRRLDFVEGRRVAFPDGQEWSVPVPMIRLAPVMVNGRFEALRSMTDMGPELDELLKAVEDAEDGIREKVAVMSVALFLLRKNYDIPDAEAPELLAWVVGEDNEHLFEILRIATGRSPKP